MTEFYLQDIRAHGFRVYSTDGGILQARLEKEEKEAETAQANADREKAEAAAATAKAEQVRLPLYIHCAHLAWMRILSISPKSDWDLRVLCSLFAGSGRGAAGKGHSRA